MAIWYLSYDGKQIGPLDQSQASAQARQNPNGYAWRGKGFTAWVPISEIDELTSVTGGKALLLPPWGVHEGRRDRFQDLRRGNAVRRDRTRSRRKRDRRSRGMMYKDSGIVMETIFGDGSGTGGGGFMDKLLGAGKRLLTGESLFMTVFTHTGTGKGHAAFGAPYPGNIIPLPLPSVGGTLICQKDSFLCAAKGVSIGIFLQRRILTGLFGGEGFIMQKLEGNGIVFVHAGGTTVERQLAPGETVHADTGCVVAIEPTVDFDIQQAGGIKTALFGGEGLFFASLRGPGRIWLQSLPFSRLAGRMLQAAPQKGGRREEGSILGSLGGLLDGDNR